MQYLKDELRNAILAAAEKEFLEKGYHNASLRKIAGQVGSTIGNLYHYFKNKEELFDELVKDEYQAFLYLLQHHEEQAGEFIDKEKDFSDIIVCREMVEQWMNHVMPMFSKRFLILLDLSEGTRYRNAKVEFIEFLQKHFLEHMQGENSKTSNELGKLVAVQFLYGIIYIIRNYNDENIKKRLMNDLFLFNIFGVIQISKS
jgi:AcrR family transcriptional regulator